MRSPSSPSIAPAPDHLPAAAAPWRFWLPSGLPPAASEQQAAARYWATWLGPICRLIPQDKRPTDRAPKTLGTGPEHRLATRDLNMIDRWWTEEAPPWFPARAWCNLGLPTGAWTGYLALDVDYPGQFDAWVAGRQLPRTLRWSSCRPDAPERYTLLYGWPRGAVIRSRAVPGGDLRADGEHVALPGSVHRTGSLYLVQQHLAVAPAPAWLVQDLVAEVRHEAPRARTSVTPPARRVELPQDLHRAAYERALDMFRRACAGAKTTVGQRHRTLLGLAWGGLARGLSADDVRAAVSGEYVTRACCAPNDVHQALQQLEEALDRPRADPRPAPEQWTVEGQARWLLAHDPRWLGGGGRYLPDLRTASTDHAPATPPPAPPMRRKWGGNNSLEHAPGALGSAYGGEENVRTLDAPATTKSRPWGAL